MDEIRSHLNGIGLLLGKYPHIVESGDLGSAAQQAFDEADDATKHAFRAVVQIVSDALGLTGPSATPMCSALAKIYEDLEHAKSPFPDQAPAVQCAVVMRSGVTIQGALSASDLGGLRMMSQCGTPGPDGIPMVEQFFDGADVEVYGVPKHVVVDTPRIIRS